LHTTTVRFDADTWAELSAEAERLGVPKATYIREATVRRLGGGVAQPELAGMRRRVEGVERQLERLAAWVQTRRR